MIKFVLVGKSGAGKSTIAKAIEKTYGLKRCITYTARPRRKGESKKAYHFVSEEEFRKLPIIESIEFGDALYGSTQDELEKADFIILDPEGADFYKKMMPWLKIIKIERESNVAEDRKNRDGGLFDNVKYDYLINNKSRKTISKKVSAILKEIIKS